MSGTIDTETYIKEKYVVIEAMSFPRKSVNISTGHCQASFCMCDNSGFVDTEHVCLTDLSGVQEACKGKHLFVLTCFCVLKPSNSKFAHADKIPLSL